MLNVLVNHYSLRRTQKTHGRLRFVEPDYFHNTDLTSEPNKISEHFKANRHLGNVN